MLEVKDLALKNGGLAGTRTPDQCLKRALLYQLSYQPNRLWKSIFGRYLVASKYHRFYKETDKQLESTKRHYAFLNGRGKQFQ